VAAKKSTKPRIEINLERVTELASRGLSQEQIAAALGIGARTLQSRKAESADFAAAIEKGRAEGIEEVANALFTNAKNGNVTAQIFFLKAQAKWKDKPELEDGDEGDAQPVKVEVTVRDARKPDADA
jgi:transcriptional regulator with XRE-family HTH domain